MKRIVLIALGWLCVGLGFIGIFVPGIPTTIFLIIALWAFSNSSKKLRDWLLNHKNLDQFFLTGKNIKLFRIKQKY